MTRIRVFPFGGELDGYQDLRALIGAPQHVVEMRALDWLHYFLLQIGTGGHIASASDSEFWDYEPPDFTQLRVRTIVDSALRTSTQAHIQETECRDYMRCLKRLTESETDQQVKRCALTHFRWVVTEARKGHRIIAVSHDYEESHPVIDPNLPFPSMRPTIFVDN